MGVSYRFDWPARFESTDETVRVGLHLLEDDQAKLTAICSKLAVGKAQLEQGKFANNDRFIKQLITNRG